MPNHNLLYTDKMGMAVGVDKLILQNAARGVVPDDIIDRPRVGFGVPYFEGTLASQFWKSDWVLVPIMKGLQGQARVMWIVMWN
ncbi:MAG: hypothetical protein DRR42_27545 [Gammaproteobacteria bacterium]|nr:MAG: hypothetical protein DRR42_27545 [Gammaproteobacteria bacterium]